MENDQIKTQIENAKRAFVASKARDRDLSADAADPQQASLQSGTDGQANLAESDHQTDRIAQEHIMGRVRELMDEAAQTRRGPATRPETQTKPFWAQNKVDIPPSEQFGKRQRMHDKDDTGTDDQLAAPAQPAPPELRTPTDPAADPLTAIRQEVFNKLGDTAGASEELQALAERVQQLEGRSEKQQQDLTALLKLVRQLANRQAELEQDTAAPRRQRGLFGPLVLVLFVMAAGIAGWLFWLDPDMMLTLSASVLNNSFDAVLNLIARFGLI